MIYLTTDEEEEQRAADCFESDLCNPDFYVPQPEEMYWDWNTVYYDTNLNYFDLY